MFQEWWKHEITSRLLCFFELLGDIVVSFEFKTLEELKLTTKRALVSFIKIIIIYLFFFSLQ